MRLPDSAQTCQPWRIHELVRDFRLEDVWALPTPGARGDFPRLVGLIAAGDPSRGVSRSARALWVMRLALGRLLRWDGPKHSAGAAGSTLRGRLPADLRGGMSAPGVGRLSFVALYRTEDEWAAEIINRTVHGVLHLGWVPDRGGGYRGQMAVYVKPNGWLGRAYMAAIGPLRHWIVYPAMFAQLDRRWRRS